jgi:hypothetical protein
MVLIPRWPCFSSAKNRVEGRRTPFDGGRPKGPCSIWFLRFLRGAQINQPRQLFETTLFPRSQKFTSIRQSLPISNQSTETVVSNNSVPEKSKVYINPSIASNIKSISRDSCLKQRCSREFKSLHQSVDCFPILNQSAKTVVWNNTFPEKSKIYINPSMASNIK